MDGVSHIVLHMALCRAALQSSTDQPLPVHVTMRYERGDPFLDKTMPASRGSSGDATLEFDTKEGQELLNISVPKYNCSGGDIVKILPDKDRRLNETLVDGQDARPLPVMLFSGTAPLAFLYTTKPTFVALDKATTCKQPVQSSIPMKIVNTYDSGAYYLSIYPDAALAPQDPVFALRLQTPTGLYHYIHVKLPPPATEGWPGDITFPVTEDMVDEIATEQPGILLCPKLWTSRVL